MFKQGHLPTSIQQSLLFPIHFRNVMRQYHPSSSLSPAAALTNLATNKDVRDFIWPISFLNHSAHGAHRSSFC